MHRTQSPGGETYSHEKQYFPDDTPADTAHRAERRVRRSRDCSAECQRKQTQ